MPGFASLDDMINEATTNGKILLAAFNKTSPAATQANVWNTLWQGTGTPGAGANPAVGNGTPGTGGTARTGTEASPVTGGMCFPDVSTDQKYPLNLSVMCSQTGTIALYDRLVDASSIALNSTGNKNVGSVALPRYVTTLSYPNEVWLEITTANTTTAPVVTLNSYTSGDGTTAQTGPAITFPAAAMSLHAAVRLPTAASKLGVRSVETINVGTAGTSGAANIVIARRIAAIPVQAGIENKISFVADYIDFQRIYDGACLYLMYFGTASVTPQVWGTLSVAYG